MDEYEEPPVSNAVQRNSVILMWKFFYKTENKSEIFF